ncbi:TldD/PmbA family protein [Paenibacillus macquariensis]|uniref:PmbA protein n=1 Tax=Paenibacillus macquariensis TaxID=948756 RepID=A0ABY1JZ49_9BACL|nr:TldD/PmbA family protein [Paenibacillus macquariensis]MEC0091244.1 TldD/PmbA family protein [Paenibacillus macquariensis]OAB37940.1 peptidase U62 [Paenibacillus macquariensis subsp. macquariensis]SIR02690.1 PmbA protein [Paenibacillus macquariensis]
MKITEFQEQLFIADFEAGFTDMELYFERTEKFQCGLHQGEVDSYVTSETLGVTFRGLFKDKMGYSFTEHLDAESLTFLILQARENAEVNEDESQETLFSGSEHYHIQDFYAEQLNELSIPDKLNILRDIEKSLYQIDHRVLSTDMLVLESSSTERGIINTKGLNLHDRNNHMVVVVSAIAQQDSQIKSAYVIHFTQDPEALIPEVIANQAVKEVVSQFNPQNAESNNYAIVLRSDAAASLLHVYSTIFSAENTQAGNSLLKDSVGEIIAAPIIQVVDDPFLANGLYSRTFDSEGTATELRSIITDGKLITLLHNRKTAEKDKTVTTGHAYKSSYKDSVGVSPTNMYIVPSESSREDLIASVQEGMLITQLSGLHSGASTVSGDFSFAAKGFYIKDGVVAYPVNQLTIAGNFYDFLKTVDQIGSDLEFSSEGHGYVGSPSLLIRQLVVTVDS